MKKIITLLVAAVVSVATVSEANAAVFGRNDVKINLNEITTDAAMKQFKKASKTNQSEIMTELMKQANEAYLDCETIEEVYEVRELLTIIRRYMASGKQSFMSVQYSINTLSSKIQKTIADYEGSTLIRIDESGYHDFGQDVQ